MQADTLEKFLSQYQPEKVAQFEQITVGISNEAFSVTCESGNRYVIRIIHLQTVESVRAEVLIQQAMASNGISTPVYLQLTNGEFVGHDGNDTFTIAKHIDGKHPEHASVKLAQSIGTMLAKLHNILDQDKIAIAYNTGQWLEPRNVAIHIAACSPAIQKRLQPVFDESSVIFNKNLPMAIIHGELASNNLFAKDDQVTTVFDFETTQYAPRILDVAYSYLSMIYGRELEPAAALQALKTGYNSEAKVKLTEAEEAVFNTAVRYASVSTAAWCFARGYDEYGEKFLKAGA